MALWRSKGRKFQAEWIARAKSLRHFKDEKTRAYKGNIAITKICWI